MATEVAVPAAVENIVEDSAPVAPTADKPQVAAGVGKKKSNPKVKKVSKPRSGSTHPTYLEMIGEAITSLKERTGSSQYAIAKFIEEKHKAHLPPNFSKVLLVQLRKFSASGKLTKVKNSYKLPAITKKPAASAPSIAKKPAATKPKSTSVTKAKPKAKLVVKPKKKVAPAIKPKTAVKVTKPKPKTVAAKTSRRPAKAAKTSAKDAPGKKAVVAKKPAVAPKATAPVKKTKTSKGAAKPPAKKTAAVKAKK
ncbi:hypothetical protein KSP39_PZI015463 [Platanthera zijinensis]|uniref:H15 domain-containing protein n=1 Tax=Platanthera zijinensis TaxID=2320716 RepID=A0AAP0B8J3_9ASPA